MKLSEMNKNPMKPKCECGKTFTSPSNLRRHKNTTVSCPIYGSQKETKASEDAPVSKSKTKSETKKKERESKPKESSSSSREDEEETKLGGRLGKSVSSLKKWMKKGASKLKGLLNVEVTINNINNNNINID